LEIVATRYPAQDFDDQPAEMPSGVAVVEVVGASSPSATFDDREIWHEAGSVR
jgi:hypothetical protein